MLSSALLGVFLGACGGASSGHVASVADAERMTRSAPAEDAALLAPQVFAEAKAEIELARRSIATGDDVTAQIHGERAIAAYQRSLVLARLSRATRDEEASREELARSEELARKLRHDRSTVERDVDELEKKLRIAREAALPAASAASADPARRAARHAAAVALAAEARLLCGAARLLDAHARGLAEAEKALGETDTTLAAGPSKAPPRPRASAPEPIDLAGRARTRCLDVLAQARRPSGEANLHDDPDVLFAELSASQASAGKPGPSRDERGVLITLRDAFRGDNLTDPSARTLGEVARVAQAHPQVAIQLVLHDADAAQGELARRRGESSVRTLKGAGLAENRIRVEHAGARIPLVDPSDAARRGRNTRLDVVFVTR